MNMFCKVSTIAQMRADQVWLFRFALHSFSRLFGEKAVTVRGQKAFAGDRLKI